jgi:hypothetical protein
MTTTGRERRSKRTDLAARIDELVLVVHRLEQTVRSRLAPPADRLTRAEAAARIGVGEGTLAKVAARGVFTDGRPNKVAGSARLYLADELDAYAADGAAGVARLRKLLGRD